GANDNASGVAALLEISRMMAQTAPARSVRFVAFTNEEPPFFFWRTMGSLLYAKAARARGDKICLMFSLETIAYYRDEPHSQYYPPLFRYFYPDRANFIAFVSNVRSRRLMRRAVDAFRAGSDFPCEKSATFSWVPGVAWSDHSSFWRQGYPALMITDTAFYRYPYYHTPNDTPEKLDYPRLGQVTEGLCRMVDALAQKEKL
ncbi:MAG: M28 family peptidase, partial [Nitrospirota bacterium]|nr:M28 family peptidase [Nitrospirota bacterium]